MAKNSNEYKAVVGDQVSLQYIIDRMFKIHGAENTNLTLQTLKIPLQINDQGQITQIDPATQPASDTSPASAPETPAPQKDEEKFPLEPPNPPAEHDSRQFNQNQ